MAVFELKWLYKATFLKSQVVKWNDEMKKKFFLIEIMGDQKGITLILISIRTG